MGERLSPVGVEPRLDAEMCGRERSEQRLFLLGDRVQVAVLPEPDRRDPRADGRAHRQPHRCLGSLGSVHADRSDRDALPERLPRLERRGPTERDRGRVGLEVRVGPVPVVFRLPQIALELEDQAPVVGERDLQPVEGVEERMDGGAVEALRSDQVGERVVDLARGRPGREARARGLAPGMVDADSDPVEGKCLPRRAVEDVLDPARLVAGDRPPPGEVHLTPGMPHLERDPEPVVALVELEGGDDAGHGVPVDVANGDVDPPDELGVADPQVAQVDAVEEEADGPRPQGAQRRERCIRSVQQPKALRGGGHDAPSWSRVAANRPSLAVNRGLSSTSGLARSDGTRPAATSSSAPQAPPTHSRRS